MASFVSSLIRTLSVAFLASVLSSISTLKIRTQNNATTTMTIVSDSDADHNNFLCKLQFNIIEFKFNK